MEHKNKWKFSNIQKRVIKLQVAYTNFIKNPLKFIIFCGINHEKILVALIKLYLRHLAK